MLKHKLERDVKRLLANHMIVIQNQGDILLQIGQLVDK